MRTLIIQYWIWILYWDHSYWWPFACLTNADVTKAAVQPCSAGMMASNGDYIWANTFLGIFVFSESVLHNMFNNLQLVLSFRLSTWVMHSWCAFNHRDIWDTLQKKKVVYFEMFTLLSLGIVMSELNLSRLGTYSVINSASGLRPFICRSQIFVILVECFNLHSCFTLPCSVRPCALDAGLWHAVFCCHPLRVWLHRSTLSGGGVAPL